MKQTLAILSLILLIRVSGAAQNAEAHDTTITTYRRSSLTSILVTHPERTYGSEITGVFYEIPIPDKFDDHTIPLQTVPLRVPRRKKKARATLDKMIAGQDIPRSMVNKWFNRDPKSKAFDMSLVHQRGNYDATLFDVKQAKQTKRGVARIDDAGQELIGNTFLLVNDITYFDKSVAAQIAGAVIKIVGIVATIAVIAAGDNNNNSTSLMDATNDLGDMVSKIEGFKVTVTSHLYRLDWSDSTMLTFYDSYYFDNEDFLNGDVAALDAKRSSYDETPDLFTLSYVGTQKVKSGKTSMKGVNRDTPEEMIRKVCARAIDKSIVKLQESHEEFRVKTPLFRVRVDTMRYFLPFLNHSRKRVLAEVGMKEGVTTRSKFEVLEANLEDDGKITYKRMGIVKPVFGKIWDNRFMAVEEEARGARRSGTEFRVVRGSNLQPGMLLRECRKPVDYQPDCLGVDVGFGGISGLGAAVDVNVRWLHNFTPHFGWEVIGVKGIYGSGVYGMQAMTGVHLQTSQFINPKKIPLLKHFSQLDKKMSLYGDYRIGVNTTGMCYEIAAGMNFTKKFFVGLAYNHQGGDTESSTNYDRVNLDMNYVALRTGFNF
ncbi:MAG: hypothetical protein LBL94_10405 [Prevotellaceae bacterium]|jgi:hypothetical protein|nr:hypothetical protein [Prevotellaceae bacterium]